MSRSAFLALAAEELLRKLENRRLLARLDEAYDDAPDADERELGVRMRGQAAEPPLFEVKPHSFGFKPGIDLDRLNHLVDELEAEEFAQKYSA